MSTTITVVGNLTADPELRFTKSGKAVAKVTVAVSDRVKDGTEWKDGEPTYWRVTVWDSLGEHAADSLSKGQRVIVVGRVASRSYETTQGEKRTDFEVTADSIGPDLKWATAKVAKAGRGSSGFGAAPAAADDPWAATAVNSDEIPF